MKTLYVTDLALSPLTLGTMTWGSPVAFDEAVKLTRYAVEAGINHIDTANMYEGYDRYAGSPGGTAEKIVGEAMKEIPRHKAVIATKLGMKVGENPEDEGTSRAAILTQLDKSLTRLDLDYVDILYLHRTDPAVSFEEILSTLDEVKRAGKIRAFGVSNYPAEKLAELLCVAEEKGYSRPVICQPPLSLLKQDAAKDILPLCQKEKIAAVPYQIFQGGLLTGKYKRNEAFPAESRGAIKPAWMMTMDDALFDRLEEWEAQAASDGVDLATFALRWVMAQPAVVSALIGVRTKEQIDRALRML
ncbi:MAG: aldo/keto reductase [Clostridia bacterium]|nr:aldo/keto reductase [Clostridia bacterium]